MKKLLWVMVISFPFFFCGSFAEAEGDWEYTYAQALFLEGNYQDAVAQCDSLLQTTYQKARKGQLYYLKGKGLLKLGKARKARACFEEILSRYSEGNLVGDATVGIGDSYFLEHNREEAIQWYKKALACYPQGKSYLYYRLGECYQKDGNWRQSRHYFDKVRKEYPASFEADLAAQILKDGLFFTVQVGSFADKTNAIHLYNELRKKGYEVYTTEITRDGNILYRVRVGRCNSQTAASRLKSKLKKEGYPTKLYP
jgi:tetratricopeptide (TPR) repeat protein